MKEKQSIIIYKKRQKDDLSLKLPNQIINRSETKRVASLKLFGAIFDENISSDSHIQFIEIKVCQNTGVLRKLKYMLSKDGLKSFYFAFIHSYLNHGNIAWGSTNKTKFKKIAIKQTTKL